MIVLMVKNVAAVFLKVIGLAYVQTFLRSVNVLISVMLIKK